MQIIRAYKTQVAPTEEQKVLFKESSRSARFVYNWLLALQNARKEETGKHVSARVLKKELNAIKDEQYPWLRKTPYTVLQEAADHLDRAWSNFFDFLKKKKAKEASREIGEPNFKKRPGEAAQATPFTVRGNISVEERRIRLPSIGWVALREFGYIPTAGVDILSATVSQRAGKWFVSVQVKEEIPDAVATGDPIGVDVGLSVLAVSSDGHRFENPKPLRKMEIKLARLQRHSKKKQRKGSNRWKRTQERIARLHCRVADIRAANHHEVSAALTGRHLPEGSRPRRIVIEDLNVKGMFQNRCLAKSLSDAGLSELHRQIAYKALWAGGMAVEADRWYASTKMCSHCGNVKKAMSLSNRTYKCDVCGLTIDRDENAAINLREWAEKEAEQKARKAQRKSGKRKKPSVVENLTVAS